MRTGPHQARPGHVSAPDPCLSKAWVFSPKSSGTRLWVVWTPRRGVRDPIRRSGRTRRGPGPCPGGLVYMYKGPTLSHGELDPLLASWSVPLSLATWLRAPRGGGE
jgi:hypothetical protein